MRINHYVHIFLICVFLTHVSTGEARTVVKPWRTIILIINKGASTDKKLFSRYEKQILSAIRALPYCEHFKIDRQINIIFQDNSANARKLCELGAQYSCDRILVITISAAEEENRRISGKTEGDQYLFLKKASFYSITADLVSVADSKTNKFYQKKVKGDSEFIKTSPELNNQIAVLFAKGKDVYEADPEMQSLPEELPSTKKLPLPDKTSLPIKKEPLIKNSVLYHMYYAISASTMKPIGIYSRYASYGIGLSGSYGIENPSIAHQYFDITAGAYWISSGKSDMRPYYYIPITISAGYLWQTSSQFSTGPFIGGGYILHKTKDKIYYDPHIDVAFRGIYNLDTANTLYTQFCYTYFFEKKANGQNISIQFGYMKFFNFNAGLEK